MRLLARLLPAVGFHHVPQVEDGLEVVLLDEPGVDEFPLLVGVLEADLYMGAESID